MRPGCVCYSRLEAKILVQTPCNHILHPLPARATFSLLLNQERCRRSAETPHRHLTI